MSIERGGFCEKQSKGDRQSKPMGRGVGSVIGPFGDADVGKEGRERAGVGDTKMRRVCWNRKRARDGRERQEVARVTNKEDGESEGSRRDVYY